MSIKLSQLKVSGNKLKLLIRSLMIKIKLIDVFTTELEMSKDNFIKALKDQVEEGYIGFFSLSFDALSSSKKVFKGHVRDDNFKIRRRLAFFDMRYRHTIARGRFKQKDHKLIIETKIMGFYGIKLSLYFFLFIAIAIFLNLLFHIFSLFIPNNMALEEKFVVILISLLQLLILFGFPYMMYNKSMKTLKNEIIKVFCNMPKK